MRRILVTAVAALFGLALMTQPIAAQDEKKGKGDKRRRPGPEAMFKNMDKDGDGKLSASEFKDGMAKGKGDKGDKGGKDRSEMMFKRMDKNNDGSLSADEFKAGMQAMMDRRGKGGKGGPPPSDKPPERKGPPPKKDGPNPPPKKDG